MNVSAFELVPKDGGGPQLGALWNLHEAFARSLSARLSAYLDTEILVSLDKFGFIALADFQKALPVQVCLIAMKLHPRPERMALSFDAAAAFALIELLLGASGDSAPPPLRPLTEIEGSLLEDAARVLASCLEEAWHSFHSVKVELESLGNDPSTLPFLDAAAAVARIAFTLRAGERDGHFEIAVPREFFEAPEAPGTPRSAVARDAGQADWDRNFSLLENAEIEMEIRLQGPTLAFGELMRLHPGQIVTFDYPLSKPLQGLLNGDVAIAGHIIGSGVNAGRKRTFQVEQLP